ncbi:phosphate/phosphite/phosphonate ABC transporter substrate-binding protein [Sutcliffiella cohnii]|uniref:Phosphonate ABC transporter substrate-binding protein n=1 Tax=Sutcliffiella cohnii TaxID=33932 RepID=A0A223KPQ6_9BACI|nr:MULTISPECIES: phosphate/phosphite/phosphonate ABC transporter substrate-binding protein [Sutcliffiella]AST91439.1 phosphonate ABC transporter substrate-binding protein [Sutcliffiella cohnii]MED4015003.1 phosphate/phosphite/phosphonate ABC transporter substrate-binding protein [Sutcliffiella cohnii]WBL17265.1 phosphate/phosphite/phosphonate ABC transporter substrate-binding protein [Sutcliffiella sp. NC1]
MKKLLTVMLVAILAVALAACGTSNNGNNAGTNNAGTNNGAGSGEEAGTEKPDKLIMGFVPSTESDKIADTVEPLAERLSEILGVEVEGSVMTNYTALVEAMGSGKVHIGFVPTFAYIQANERYDIEVILKSIRNGSSSYKAQYLVRADSGIESFADLEGKIWAFGDITSTSGFLFPAVQLMQEFDIDSTDALQQDFFAQTVAVGSHDNAALTVLDGDADVATTFDDVRDVLEADYPEVKEELVVLGYTDPIPNDTISVIPSLDPAFVEEIKQAFLSFNDDEEMIEIMNDVYRWTGIDEASDEEYDIVRDVARLTGYEG